MWEEGLVAGPVVQGVLLAPEIESPLPRLVPLCGSSSGAVEKLLVSGLRSHGSLVQSLTAEDHLRIINRNVMLLEKKWEQQKV